MNNSSLSLPFLKVCLGEVDGGKRFSNVKVEELEAGVAEANAKDNPARAGRYTGKNWSLHRQELIGEARR